MKKLILDSFKTILNLDVRVINLPEEDIDMAIYIVRDKKFAKLNEKKLAEYSFDYAVTRLGSEFTEWIYLTVEHTDGVVRNGEPVEPPDSIVHESVMDYKSSEDALQALIIAEIKNKFNDLLMCREEMNEV